MHRQAGYKLLIALALTATFLAPLRAQERPTIAASAADRPQVAAATTEAVANLREQIERTPITLHVTVGEFLRRTGGSDDLTKTLARAELVGGPRWVDADTCQIQLEISGPRIAHLLNQIAANHPRESPINAKELSRETETWRERTFSGTGSSTAFGRVNKLRGPALTGSWANVSDADRQKALAAAKADAIARVIDSIKPIPLASGKTIGDALANPEVHTALLDWLENRPITRVDYRRDLQLELSMAGTPHGCFDTLRHAITKHSDLLIPRDEAGWSDIRTDFEHRMASPIGHATASATAPAAGPILQHPRLALPSTPPSWIERKLEVEGIADPGNSKLRAAREAESIARRALAEEIGRLPLSPGLTIAQASEQNPHINDAVSQALDKTKSKTDYNHRRGVSVILTLDLHDLWDSLRAAQ